MGVVRVRIPWLVPALAALVLVLALARADSGEAMTRPAGAAGSEPEVLTRVARVDQKFQVSIKVRCVSPADSRCVGFAYLTGRGWWALPGTKKFTGPVARHRGLYTVAAGGWRAIRFEIESYVRRPRDEHAGHHWVTAEFSNLLGVDAKRAVLLRWHRLERPPTRPAH